jgi:hypothetical protein
MVRESSPSVLAANLLAKMNTAEAESMAQRRRSCINQSTNQNNNNQSINQTAQETCKPGTIWFVREGIAARSR